MKQNIDIEEKAQSQNMQDKHLPCDFLNCRISLISAILPTGKGTQHLGRDGPPGRARSPGIHFREGQQCVPSSLFNTEMNSYKLIQTKIQLFTNINYLKS